MSHRASVIRALLAAGVAALALASATGRSCASVAVALTPASQEVVPGSDFNVFVDVTNVSSAFNGFDLVVDYDPTALTLLPLSPTTLQQGCLMTGGCSAACGNTFHLFNTAADSAAVSDVLLCNGVALVGPGRVYQLRFRASNTPQATNLTIRSTHFYNAGLFVTPVTSAGCVVGIGVNVGVEPSTAPAASRVRIEPNPTFGRTDLVFEGVTPDLVEVEIIDLQGRVLRHLGPATVGPQARLSWDGNDSKGTRAPAGLYLVKIRRRGQVQNSRVILLK